MIVRIGAYLLGKVPLGAEITSVVRLPSQDLRLFASSRLAFGFGRLASMENASLSLYGVQRTSLTRGCSGSARDPIRGVDHPQVKPALIIKVLRAPTGDLFGTVLVRSRFSERERLPILAPDPVSWHWPRRPA